MADFPTRQTPGDESPDGYIAEIMQREAELAAHAAAAPVSRRRRSRVSFLFVLLLILVVLSVWNLVRASRPPVAFSPEEEIASMRFTVYLIARGLEAHRRTEGRLPRNLEEAGLDVEGISYAVSDSTYVLTGVVGEDSVVYRSGDDLSSFGAALRILRAGGSE
ncbi:MAG: hypothetical protein ACE5PT_03695 [Gemmatimonadales bacterium]